MTQTTDHLPEITAFSTISEQKVQSYQEKGHTIIRGLANQSELDAYYPSILEAVEKHRREKETLEKRDTYHKAFLQVGNLWTRDERIRKFVFAKRFAKVAAELMGVPAVRIYHDQALFKEPGGGHTPWHQDQYYWPIDTNKTLTMWMPFTTAPIEKGSLTFASRLQDKEALVQLAIGNESSAWFEEYMQKFEVDLQTYELKPGDATFHSGWTPHKAPGNATDQMRPVMTVIYMAADAKVSEPKNIHQPIDMETFFPGRTPGDACDTNLNPILYDRSIDG